MSALAALQGPLIIFCLFVAPIWIITHYRHKNRVSDEASVQDRDKIESLLKQASLLEERVITLENILDKNHPNWRHEI